MNKGNDKVYLVDLGSDGLVLLNGSIIATQDYSDSSPHCNLTQIASNLANALHTQVVEISAKVTELLRDESCDGFTYDEVVVRLIELGKVDLPNKLHMMNCAPL